jgi:hypothetical protein
MIDLQECIRRLSVQAEAIAALVRAFPDEALAWSPGPDVWSPRDVAGHLLNEERGDFRRHLKEMFGEPAGPSGPVALEDGRQALAEFMAERRASIAWLSALAAPDWAVSVELHFGSGESLTFSAGDMLVSWVEHDVLHLRQMVELLHAWNGRQAAPYALRYAGDW